MSKLCQLCDPQCQGYRECWGTTWNYRFDKRLLKTGQ